MSKNLGHCEVWTYLIIKLQDYFADEIGVLSPNQLQVEELYAGEVK